MASFLDFLLARFLAVFDEDDFREFAARHRHDQRRREASGSRALVRRRVLQDDLFLVGGAFYSSRRLIAWRGGHGLRAVSQVIGLFLAAIAVNMIRRGLQAH